MRPFFRSLRVRLGLLYILFTLISMVCLGCFSYWYLGRILASSRQLTMTRREERIVTFVSKWPGHDAHVGLSDKLRQPSYAIAETDTIQVRDLSGNLVYSSPGPDIYKAGWPNQPCATPCYSVVRRGGHTIRTLSHVVTLDGQRLRLSIAGTTDEHADILRMIRNSYLICCPLLLIASVAGGFLLSQRALQPIHRITSAARIIGIKDLKHRLPVRTQATSCSFSLKLGTTFSPGSISQLVGLLNLQAISLTTYAPQSPSCLRPRNSHADGHGLTSNIVRL